MNRLILLLCCFTAVVLTHCRRGDAAEPEPRARLWTLGLDSLEAALARLEAQARADAPDSALQHGFRDARLQFKRMEFLWEYAFPASAKKLNGPAVDEVEKDEQHAILPAEGFQVVEASLFPAAPEARDELAGRVGSMLALIWMARKARGFEPAGGRAPARPLAWTDSSLLDAARLELARIGFLGITGFDSPVARHSLPESRAALEGLSAYWEAAFPPVAPSREVVAKLRAAARMLDGGFDSFDRLRFLREGLNPAYAALGDFREELKIPVPAEERAFLPGARDLFHAGAWNPDFFRPDFVGLVPAPPATAASLPAQIALGRRLFSDPALSGDHGRSCVTCHRPDRGFTDGRRRSPALGGGMLPRNTPSLLHAAFQQGAFLDLRAESLEDQANMVIHNPREMGGSLADAARTLARDPAYAGEFRAAFAADPAGRSSNTPVTPERIRRALTAYVRSLSPFNSPWDRYMRGEDKALDREARLGFNVFMGKAGCATCHFPPLFNGTVPPLYGESDLEVLGVPAERTARGARARGVHAALDGDPGRMAVDHVPLSRGAFKTPTVRNAAFTAPYMHNGVFATLEEVVEFYDQGGGAGLGLEVPNQTLPADSLHLTEREEKALVAFLRALSDTAGTTAVAPGAAERYGAAGYPK